MVTAPLGIKLKVAMVLLQPPICRVLTNGHFLRRINTIIQRYLFEVLKISDHQENTAQKRLWLAFNRVSKYIYMCE